jgi:DMSO/TMAO reductase YedYZ molybdopterin-dependent catalytic subunit
MGTGRAARPPGPNQLLPAGQRSREVFPRFGLPRFATRWPDAAPTALRVTGEVRHPQELLPSELAALPRREQTADLHCVTTWSVLRLRWGGMPFRDFYDRVVVPRAQPLADCHHQCPASRCPAVAR